ncbi:MAG TPA: hypothetical protein DCQ31_03445 [Bacteroidales bacterium]|nr:hypothetical protein [Bacteroidales bacterium]
MTYLEALYGSQYYDLTKSGRNPESGRMTANLFLTAFIIISLFLLIALPMSFSSAFENSVTDFFHSLFGSAGGKAIGRILAFPLMAVIYFVIFYTIGTKKNYDAYIESFNKYPTEEKEKATMKILKPFFIVLGGFFLLAMSSLF